MTQPDSSPTEPSTPTDAPDAGPAAPRSTALADAATGVRAWLEGRIPQEWSSRAPEVVVDRDEVSVVLALADGWGEGPEAVQRFREETREQRVVLARGMERQWNREVAWGAVAAGHRAVFTSLSVPTMTRLRQPERAVLDVLVDSGVARSRSDALAWCVRLVAQNTGTWLAELRTALRDVDRLRAEGPTITPPAA